MKHFVNASTGGAILGEAQAPIHEDMPARPLSPYGASKLATEGYCFAFTGSFGLRTLSLRFSNVYGPNSFHKGSVIAHFIRQIIKGESLIIYGDGSQARDFIFVEDLVKGIGAAISSAATGVYLLGSGRPTTVNELLHTMRNIVGPRMPFSVQHKSFRKGEIHTTWPSINKARNDFGFDPNTTLESGLTATWEWFNNSLPKIS